MNTLATERAAAPARLVPLMATLLVGAVAALLDTTITAVALDTLQRELNATVTTVQWVTTGYVLAMTAVIPLVGWTVGRFGARNVWTAALLLFLLGSVLSGLAWSAGSLIAFRVVHGLGGGFILPLTQLVTARAAGPQRLGRVMALGGLIGGLAPMAGPVLGGVLIDTWGWRWVFFVNVPIVLAVLLMTWRWFPRDDERSGRPLDVAGLALLPTALVALLFGLSGGESGSGSPLVAAAGAVLLTAFVVRTLRRGGTGLVDLRLFRQRSFRGGAVMMFLGGATNWGPMFLLPLYYQQTRGLDALEAGVMLLPQSVGMMLSLTFSGWLADRFPPRPLAFLGLGLAAVATAPFLLDAPSELLLGAALLVRGLGYGIGNLPASVALYRLDDPAALPDATSLGNVIQRVGAATGTALMALVLATAGFGTALTWMFGLTVAGAAAAVLLPGRR